MWGDHLLEDVKGKGLRKRAISKGKTYYHLQKKAPGNAPIPILPADSQGNPV